MDGKISRVRKLELQILALKLLYESSSLENIYDILIGELKEIRELLYCYGFACGEVGRKRGISQGRELTLKGINEDLSEEDEDLIGILPDGAEFNIVPLSELMRPIAQDHQRGYG